MSSKDVSIIIRTLNESKYLRELLEAIKYQKTNYDIETIVIDSGSTDTTVEIAREYNCKILFINKNEFSFGRSLNRACDYSKGKFLVFISGHCIPVNGSWIERLVEPLMLNQVDYSYGRQLGGKGSFWSEKMIFKKYFPEVSYIPQKGFFCNNANSAIKREIWSKYKFDENLTGLEDIDLAKRVVNGGGEIGYVSESKVYHLHKEKWIQIQRRFEREAIALKKISPEIFVRKRDLIRYFLSSVLIDLLNYRRKSLNPKELINIFYYRLFQYLGTYKGNKSDSIRINKMKEIYYYPNVQDINNFGNKSYKSSVKTSTNKTSIIALLPMKKHSSRVSGKNFRNLNGKPLYKWILDTLLSIDLIDKVIINTDADEILKNKELASLDKIKLQKRPNNLCGDFVSMNKIIEYDIGDYSNEIFLMTHTTNPLLSANTISKALNLFLKLLNEESYDSLFTVNRLQSRLYDKDAKPLNHSLKELKRTQDLEPIYEENSNLYLFTKDSFKCSNNRIGSNPYLYVTPYNESFDIDEKEDWDLIDQITKF